MAPSTILGLIVLILLLISASYLALAETSILTVSLVQARLMEEEGRRGAATLNKILKKRSDYLTTILLLTLVTNLTATTIASTLAYRSFKSWGAVLATAVMTVVIFIYCEVAPKTYAVRYADKMAAHVAGPVLFLGKAFGPAVHLLAHIATLSMRLVGIHVSEPGPYMTEEELLTAVEISEEEGVIKEEEKRLIHHIFEFGDTIVREVMMPRPDMICIKDNVMLSGALDFVVKEGHSRVPVYKDTIDNIVGILYARDLMAMVANKTLEGIVKDVMRPAMFVPETKRVADLLREIQRDRVHLAVVIDEYGSTAGLVTMEDLLEEIVGEIYDEYDAGVDEIETLGEGRLRVDGRTPVDDVSDYFQVKLDYQEVDSIGGLMLELFGRVPKRAEMIKSDGLTFRIEKVTGKRVRTVLIYRADDAGDNRKGER